MDIDDSDSEAEKWSTGLYDFTQKTSIDGVKQVTEPTRFCCRRVLWACLLVGSIALFIKQMADSVLYFRSYPVAVNLNINYNKTLKFPAVTICNQNNFRATVASSRGEFSLISDLYVQNKSNIERQMSLDDSFHSQSISNVMFALKHDKHDFIVSCAWEHTNCSADAFVTSPTDHGICYSFNSGRDSNVLRSSSQAGTDGGLRLKLNIEQYEYMQGPNEGAGLKILIHDQGDVALVKDLGQAVQTGSHAFVDVNIIKVQNLPKPHGHCDEKNLTLYKKYTMSSCLMECRTLYVTTMCDCIDYYMPWQTFGGPRFCTIRQIVECVRPALEIFNEPDECDCPVPCDFTVFNPSITFLATSTFDAAKMLHDNYSLLQTSYTLSQEVRQRVDTYVSTEDHKMATLLNHTVLDLNELFEEIIKSLTSTEQEITNYVNEFNKRTSFHLYAVRGVYYILRHNFIRGWEIVEERTLPYLCHSFFELQSSVDQFYAMSANDEFDRKVQRHMLDDFIQNKLHLCSRANRNVTRIYKAYQIGKPLLSFKKTKDKRYDLDFISLELLHGEMSSDERDKLHQNITESVQWVKDSLHELDVALQSEKEQGLENAHQAVQDYVAACKSFNKYRFLFRDRIVHAPLQEAQHRIDEFESKFKALEKNVDWLLDHTFEIKFTLRYFNGTYWQPLVRLANLFIAYVHSNDITKLEVANTFKSRRIQMDLLEVQQYFTKLLLRLKNVQDSIETFGQSYLDLYKNMLNEASTKKLYLHLFQELRGLETNTSDRVVLERYYAYLLGMRRSKMSQIQLLDLYVRLNADFPTTDWKGVVNDIANITRSLHLNTEFSSLLGERGDAFINTMGTIIKSLQTFSGKNKIDHNFYRENFIHLDIFFHELSYQEVSQQKAYDLTSLMCDIGGLMELFLGASILSLCEIFDFVFFLSVLKAKHSRCQLYRLRQ